MLFCLTANYTPKGLEAMGKNPKTNRREAVEKLLNAAGATGSWPADIEILFALCKLVDQHETADSVAVDVEDRNTLAVVAPGFDLFGNLAQDVHSSPVGGLKCGWSAQGLDVMGRSAWLTPAGATIQP